MLFEQVVTGSGYCRAYKVQRAESPTYGCETSWSQTRERIRTVSKLEQYRLEIWIYPPSAVRSGTCAFRSCPSLERNHGAHHDC
jgi:hypothetical protein